MENKIYFANYLEIPGEIKEGDIILKYSYDPKFYKATNIEVVTNKEGLTHYVPHKLFICSSKINVGDEDLLHFPDTNIGLRFKCVEDLGDGVSMIEYTKHPSPKHKSAIGTKREWLTHLLFKVIGEVSPGAIWVKEGDRFNFEDLSANGCGVNWNPDGEKLIYKFKVKCENCETFH